MDAARHEFGLNIPTDLCVVGYDDIEPAGWQSYDLTTFRQPVDQIADYIADLLEAPERSARAAKNFQPLPVWRRSVRPKSVVSPDDSDTVKSRDGSPAS
jgi:DNA-binding LacI/PurR family transcriptional regulator